MEARTRWYTHGWNTDLSWRLILGIIPRVPPFLCPPFHLITTLICFAAMGRERRAVQRNFARVTGKRGAPLLLLAFRLFHDFSKFMVAYVEVPPYGRGLPERRVAGRDRAKEVIAEALAEERGLIVLNMHLGQWDLALIDLAESGIPITVVMRREEEAATRWAAGARAAAGLQVIYAGESPWASVELLSRLRRNEIVALQGDRPYGGRNMAVDFFGEAAIVPTGPWDLARVSGAPVLPAALIIEGHRRFRHVMGDLLRPGDEGAEAEGSEAGTRRLAAAMESLIRDHPTQWFNFYDVWGIGRAA